MENPTVCFTGHRELPENKLDVIADRIEKEVEYLIKKGYRNFESGGALGFDILTAQVVLKLKKKYPHINLILILPCKEQSKYWGKNDIKIYDAIKKKADKIVYTSEFYYKGCMHKRNRKLVAKASVCLCYLEKNSGGTFYTVHYAEAKGLKLINIAE